MRCSALFDYTIFFRELSSLPTSVAQSESSFYNGDSRNVLPPLNNGSSIQRQSSPQHTKWKKKCRKMSKSTPMPTR